MNFEQNVYVPRLQERGVEQRRSTEVRRAAQRSDESTQQTWMPARFCRRLIVNTPWSGLRRHDADSLDHQHRGAEREESAMRSPFGNFVALVHT
jgi:hypothetical protein